MTDAPGLPSADDSFLRPIPPIEGIIAAFADEGEAREVCIDLDMASEPSLNDHIEVIRVKNLVLQCIEHQQFFETKHGYYLLSIVSRGQDKFTLNDLAVIRNRIRSACAAFKSDEWIFTAGDFVGLTVSSAAILEDAELKAGCEVCFDFALDTALRRERRSMTSP